MLYIYYSPSMLSLVPPYSRSIVLLCLLYPRWPDRNRYVGQDIPNQANMHLCANCGTALQHGGAVTRLKKVNYNGRSWFPNKCHQPTRQFPVLRIVLWLLNCTSPWSLTQELRCQHMRQSICRHNVIGTAVLDQPQFQGTRDPGKSHGEYIYTRPISLLLFIRDIYFLFFNYIITMTGGIIDMYIYNL